MTGDCVVAAIRESNERYFAELRANARPDCRLCHGWGVTRGYISPGKYATYACTWCFPPTRREA